MKVKQIAPNQLEINADEFTYFQSYETVIAKVNNDSGQLTLDEEKWNYSATTSKFRNRFTGLTTQETKDGIEDGSIELDNLNKIGD